MHHYVLVGLGNPDSKYLATRHNLAKDMVEQLANSVNAPFLYHQYNCTFTEPIQLSSLPPSVLAQIYLNFDKARSVQQSLSKFTPLTLSDHQKQEEGRSDDGGCDDEPLLTLTSQQEIINPHQIPTTQPKPSNPHTFYGSIPSNIYITLALSESYMNKSAKSVEALATGLKLKSLSQLIILHDDMDLPCGNIKVKNEGTSGGHKGIDHCFKKLGSDADFIRCRLGIGRPIDDLSVVEFVLKKFTPKEKQNLSFISHYLWTAVIQSILYPIQRANNHIQNMYHEHLQQFPFHNIAIASKEQQQSHRKKK